MTTSTRCPKCRDLMPSDSFVQDVCGRCYYQALPADPRCPLGLCKVGDDDRLREMLSHLDFSHVSYRSWCGQDQLYVYRRSPGSPTQCNLVGGAHDCVVTRQVLADEGTEATAGGQRGYAACAAGMRG